MSLFEFPSIPTLFGKGPTCSGIDFTLEPALETEQTMAVEQTDYIVACSACSSRKAARDLSKGQELARQQDYMTGSIIGHGTLAIIQNPQFSFLCCCSRCQTLQHSAFKVVFSGDLCGSSYILYNFWQYFGHEKCNVHSSTPWFRVVQATVYPTVKLDAALLK
ncbi:hypothetical protein BU25DRAFT_39241 [Macroventuria anomochaeta]|uniref:Uncharacterized protein n=1 Tax=Macroventuria anomochaeta TaxID=301207 RepID=A0ACB6S342_9PLEO|nr:uncharacterized protein BU25DRAFT_39241 [Macroventuria anomochaeta]KAF2628075.1 hypothetical protein BU25DRAFT_39241 [Macroventuria anomochaeta]